MMEALQGKEGESLEKGTLYLVATPIGNLEDMTYRAVRILSEADLVAAEDTRHTRGLLSHFDVHKPLVSYHEHNKAVQGGILIEEMLAGKSIACVSDAGLPGIADPGAQLARLAIEAGIPVVPVPGACAALTALIASGLDTRRFSFVGFLPRTKKKRKVLLEEIRSHSETLLFYEAPHHLKEMMKDLIEYLGGERHGVLCRELTKKFEEFRRGTLDQILSYYDGHEIRGEIVLAVEGSAKDIRDAKECGKEQDPMLFVEKLISSGMERKEAMRETAKRLGISRRTVYRLMLEAGEALSKDEETAKV